MASSTAVLPEKCPCCDNPWARATGELFAKICAECETKQVETTKPTFGLSRDNMDHAIQPQDNFFRHANGGWMEKNPIPAGYPSWNTFLALHVQSQERCKALLEDLMAGKLDEQGKEANAEEQAKVANFYSAAMDEAAVEALGVEPVQPVLELIDRIVAAYDGGNKEEYARLLGTMAATYGIYPFFSTSASPDYKDSDHTLCQLSQGGLGLPDKDYYYDEDKQEIREAYLDHVARMLTLLLAKSSDEPTDEMKQRAKEIFDLELELAEAHMTRTENRDPMATYNKMSIADLMARGSDGAFAFDAYLSGSTGKESVTEGLGDINVRNTAALERVAKVASTVKSAVLKDYLQWQAINSLAPYLSDALVKQDFEFYEKKLSGTQEIKPRWKRAMAFTEKALGEALGQLYCAKYFDQDCKGRAETIVESVRSALESRLKEVDWIKAESTREQALKKMSRFRVKIGYPNKWIDYTPLEISTDDTFLSMVFKARAFEHKREVDEMNAPTDREKWFMTPQTVNAYYHPSLNEIVFPAAILQHPFFDPNADDAVNYGAMGAVVGHEMTHGFDDKGRKFDYTGALQDWWSEEDAKEYEGRVEVMVEQANNFKVLGKSVQGKLTSGENIADLGGLRLALRALKAKEGFDDSVEIDGFTPTQRFFLAWAQCWRQNVTDERSLQLLTLDPHGPNEMRCNGPLSNMPEFHAAFEVPTTEETPMYRPVESRVDIW